MMDLSRKLGEERVHLVTTILNLPDEVKTTEPDVFALTQNFWSDGMALYEAHKAKNYREAYSLLLSGPWSNSDLNDYLNQLLYIKELHEELGSVS